jgi:NAD(P)-dependent dehydrogenase (short-subunit alcohol dehydrogenase family)
MRLQEKKAIVTGANGGMGQAICRLFSQEGADVAMISRSVTFCKPLAEEIKQQGRNAFVIQVDLSQVDGIKKAIDEAHERLGGIDILVSNAGAQERNPIEGLSLETWENTFSVNVKAPFFLIQAAVEHMKPKKDGRIVCIGTRGSKDGGVNVGISYVASKAGLDLLVIKLAKDLGPFGIRINGVRPGPIDTPMLNDLSTEQKVNMARAIPLRRLGLPSEVAQAALFLASDESSFISGALLDVTGGL